MSLSRVWLSMKPLSGTTPRSSATVVSIVPAMYGCTASVLMRSTTGAITKKRQEQRQADQHLVRRRLAGADRLAQDRQHDHDARERGHHQQDGRQQRHRRHQHQDLQRQRVGLAAARPWQRSRPGMPLRSGAWAGPAAGAAAITS